MTSKSNISLIHTKFSEWLHHSKDDNNITKSFKEFLKGQKLEFEKSKLFESNFLNVKKQIPSTSTTIHQNQRKKVKISEKNIAEKDSRIFFNSSIEVEEFEENEIYEEDIDDGKSWLNVKSFPEFSIKNKFGN